MGINIRTITDIRLFIREELNETYPENEIRALTNIILRKVFATHDLHTLTDAGAPVTPEKVHKITSVCEELKKGKPVQYILGETEFYNCLITVNSETLIPRPETEELVDMVIKENRGFTGNILDVGTGSGCIAISLAINLPGTNVTGIDISEGAVEVAKKNAGINNASVSFYRADILSPDLILPGNTGIIVSNPPYIRELEKPLTGKNVIGFEPHSALFVPDSDPLVYYRAILEKSELILNRDGKIYFEINEAFGNPMADLMLSFGYKEVEIVKDLNGKDRIMKGIKNGRKQYI